VSRRRAPRKWKLPLSADQIAAIAAELVQNHQRLVARDGFRLCGSSGIWRCANGSYTGRMVYKLGAVTVVHTVRGMRVSEPVPGQ
jgi:hypothetical protein